MPTTRRPTTRTPRPKAATAKTKSSNAKQREKRSAGWEAVGRAYEMLESKAREIDDPGMARTHPWVKDLADALRFWRSVTVQIHMEDHLNVFVSIPNDLDDIDLWPSLTDIIQATANSVRLLEERQQEVVLEARRRGVTWTEIGKALGTTRQSAWARYSGED